MRPKLKPHTSLAFREARGGTTSLPTPTHTHTSSLLPSSLRKQNKKKTKQNKKHTQNPEPPPGREREWEGRKPKPQNSFRVWKGGERVCCGPRCPLGLGVQCGRQSRYFLAFSWGSSRVFFFLRCLFLLLPFANVSVMFFFF